MPVPNTPPQAGWLVALGTIFGGIVMKLIDLAAKWREKISDRTAALEIKAVDSKDTYTSNLREDVESLRHDFAAQQTTILGLIKAREDDALVKVENASKIADLQTEIKRLKYEVAELHDDKARTKKDYDEHIATLTAQLADKQTRIGALEQQIADLEVIGVGEKAPPRRMKGDSSP